MFPLPPCNSGKLYILLSDKLRLDNHDFLTDDDILKTNVNNYLNDKNNNNLRLLIDIILERIYKIWIKTRRN